MKRFYLSGHKTFGNRGCEAIVRSTVSALREAYGDVTVLVPSDDINRDSNHWPQATAQGVEFVDAYTPPHLRYWVHLQRLPFPLLKRAGWPFSFPQWLKKQIESVDAVISVGGDNYSLDYRLPSLLMGMDALAMDLGKPVTLWGASVGPFEREPHFIPTVRSHLARMEQIFVRESVSYQYLTNTLGLKNVTQTVDPAFTLKPEAIEKNDIWPEASEHGVLGLNVSPLIERYKRADQSLLTEVEGFIRKAIGQGFSVLLVPHVIPLDGSTKNNDAYYMQSLLDRCCDLGRRLTMMPGHLNASQIKHVISKLRYFIGARTHATIASLSSGVPTISISYSVKARGINRDLFGDEDFVLPTPELSTEALLNALGVLIEREDEVRDTLGVASRQHSQIIAKSVAKIGGRDG